MNFIRNNLDKIKKPFEKGGKLEKFYPAFDAFETFLFVPNHTTIKGSHIRDAVDLKRTMVTVIIALMPALFYGIYNTGYQYFIQSGLEFTFLDAMLHGAYKNFPMIVVSYVVGLSIEFGFAVYRGHPVNEGYLVTGLLIPMIMPVDMPLWMLAVSVIFAVLIAKEAFGGTGMNILNPALTARAFAFFAYPTYMSGDKVWVSEASNIDGISGETILGSLAAGQNIDYSSIQMFWGSIPGSVAETSTLFVLIGAAILLFTGSFNNIEIIPEEEIQIETSQYQLYGMVVWHNGHYVSFYRCNDEYYFYNDMNTANYIRKVGNYQELLRFTYADTPNVIITNSTIFYYIKK